MSENIENDQTWDVVKAFFEENNLLKHQIESFNDFVEHYSYKIFDLANRWEIVEGGRKYLVELNNLCFQSPRITEIDGTVTKSLTPMQCLHRNISYMSEVYVDVTITPPETKATTHKKILIGMIPVMVRSDLCNLYQYINDDVEIMRRKECIYDKGGYFVIFSRNDSISTAQRKVLCLPEKPMSNKVFIFRNHKKPKYEVYADIKSNSRIFHTTTTLVGICGKKITAVLPWIEAATIPIGVVFAALGITNPRKIIKYVFGDELVEISEEERTILQVALEFSYECDTQDKALEYIGKRGKKYSSKESEAEIEINIDYEEQLENEDEINEKIANTRADIISYAQHLLESELFPHLSEGEQATAEKKLYFLGYMIRKVIRVYLGLAQPEDRDHYAYKRITSVKTLLGQQLYGSLKRLQSEITTSTRKAMAGENIVNILMWMKPSILTNAMIGALANNKWGMRGNATAATKGISQIYEQFNYAASLANARKLVVPMAAEGGKIIAPRDVHGSHWLVVCPSESPEGKKCGLIKNIALTGMLSIGTDSMPLRIFFLNDKRVEANTWSPVGTKLLLDGDWLGMVRKAKSFVKKYVDLRRANGISREVSIVFDKFANEIRVSTDAGRLMRPVFIVDDGKLVIAPAIINDVKKKYVTWENLYDLRCVEIIDKDEEESCYVALNPDKVVSDHTHCELNPALMFGVGGSIIPHPNRNQSPRNCYQASMGKQSVGLPFLNYRFMMTGNFHVMGYLQRPLSMTRSASIIEFDALPAGQNAIVAIICRENNEEDSIEFNRASLERGFMQSYKYVSYYAELRGDNEFFQIPNADTCGHFRGNIETLDDDAIVAPGTRIKNDDLLVGKVVKNSQNHKHPYTSDSTIYEHEWPAVVDHVQRGITGDGYQYVRVMTVQRRDPINGDKFCFTPDHEVLTSEGWIKVESITLSHKLATLDKQFELCYERPISVCEFDLDDEQIIDIRSKDLDLSITTNHHLLTSTNPGVRRFALFRADSISTDTYHYRSSKHYTPSRNTHFSSRGAGLPEWVWQLSAKRARSLVRNYDGFHTNNLDFLNDLQRLALHAGLCAIINKTTRTFELRSEEPIKVEFAAFHRKTYTGKVYCATVPNGTLYVRRTSTNTLKPVWTGNSAVCAQKGTIGAIVNQEDMPFNPTTGMVPDIMINAIAFPSRMTIGMFIEAATGKVISSTNILNTMNIREVFKKTKLSKNFKKDYINPFTGGGDSTPFREDRHDLIQRELIKLGFDGRGYEEMISGITGESMEAMIFMGPIYYQRLRHMVIDKVHARAHGPRTTISHQPTDGRVADGGLRCGVQERDCLLGQGGSRVIRDRMMEQSDEYRMWVCDRCGLNVTVHEENQDFRFCEVCHSSEVSKIRMPYGAKLVSQELAAMNIVPRIL